MQFTEQTALETGFAQVFQIDVRPRLMALEEQRVAGLATAKKWVAIALGGSAAVVALMLAVFGSTDWTLILALFGGVIGVIGAIASWQIQAKSWGSSVAEAVMPAICAHVGDLRYDQSGGGHFPADEMRALGMFGSYNRSSFEDRLDGTHRDTRFAMVEALLQKKTRTSDNKDNTTTIFRGLLFEIGVPIEVPAPILITRDRGGFGNKLGELFSGSSGRGMEKVAFDHPGFEAAFEVYSDDPDFARRMMPSAFLDNLLTIGEDEGGRKGTKGMRAAFQGKRFFLALSRSKDFMRMGSLTTPVRDMEPDIHDIFSDIEVIHRIIDRLHGD